MFSKDHYDKKIRDSQAELHARCAAILKVLFAAQAVSPEQAMSVEDLAKATGLTIGLILDTIALGPIGGMRLPVFPTVCHWPFTASSRFFIVRSNAEIEFYCNSLSSMKFWVAAMLDYCCDLNERGLNSAERADEDEPEAGAGRLQG